MVRIKCFKLDRTFCTSGHLTATWICRTSTTSHFTFLPFASSSAVFNGGNTLLIVWPWASHCTSTNCTKERIRSYTVLSSPCLSSYFSVLWGENADEYRRLLFLYHFSFLFLYLRSHIVQWKIFGEDDRF